MPRKKQELIAKPLERKSKQLRRIKCDLWKKSFKLKLQPMGLKGKQSGLLHRVASLVDALKALSKAELPL